MSVLTRHLEESINFCWKLNCMLAIFA